MGVLHLDSDGDLMPAPPPVPAAQRYPLAIRDFVAYQNQPQDGTKIFIVQNLDGTTTTVDLTLDAAAVTKDLHTEIISLEQILGQKPFMTPGSNTVGRSINYLYNSKAEGHVDARNCITPPPAPSHYHRHFMLTGLGGDDHPQYMRHDGARPFTRPVTAPGAVDGDDLITLAQAKVAGLNSSQVQGIINSYLASQKLDPNDHNLTGPDGRRWKMSGGFASGYTDGNGNLWVDLTPAQFSYILSFIYCKMPFPGGSMLGWYAYQYMEDQLVLLGLSPQGAMIQFIEDIRVDRQALVCMCWMALGI